jgi:uncharacterized membrane protein
MTLLVIVWAVVTAAFLAVMFWKAFAGLKEADVVILDPAEAKQADEQQQVIARMERLTSWAKRFGFASLAMLLVTGGLLAYRVMHAFRLGLTP